MWGGEQWVDGKIDGDGECYFCVLFDWLGQVVNIVFDLGQGDYCQ